MAKNKCAVEITQKQIESDEFKSRHRHDDKAFTRERRLPFALMMVLIMRNSVKSLQNVVNEAMTWLDLPPVTASAYSQARYKLKHTAFIELNQTAVVDNLYGDGDYQRFWGVPAVDDSKPICAGVSKPLRPAQDSSGAWQRGVHTQNMADCLSANPPYSLIILIKTIS